jgi:hypothetical protein
MIIDVPDDLGSLHPSGFIRPVSFIRPSLQHECLQETPITLPDDRILRKAQDSRRLFPSATSTDPWSMSQSWNANFGNQLGR